MKFKYYLRGIGLGIIITTVILTISVRVRGGIMTDDRVIERAAELGMIIPEEESSVDSETEAGDDTTADGEYASEASAGTP